MSRAVVAWNRVVTLLLGLVLLALGAAAVLWWLGTFPGWPTQLHTDQVTQATQQPWWPWAAGGAGLVLALLGLRWLASHLPDRGVTTITLPGSSRAGRLDAQVRPIASAAAEAFALTPGVRSARGVIQEERGQVIAKLRATVEPHVDLQLVAAAADRVSADLRQVMQRDDIVCQVNLAVARSEHAAPRVD